MGTRQARASALDTIASVLQAANLGMYPATPWSVITLGAILKSAGFRSTANYISIWLTECGRRGHPESAELLQAAKDARRAATRGIGPPSRARPVPLGLLANVADERVRCTLLVASWWCMREAEASHVRTRDVVFDRKAKSASILFRSSKTDQQGLGCWRTHGCSCGARGRRRGPGPRKLCPYHAARWLQPAAVGRGSKYLIGVGRKPGKKACFVRELRAAMREVAPGSDTSGFTGHSCRRGGAQFLLMRNAGLQEIMSTGRWTSAAIHAYFAGAKPVDTVGLAARLLSEPLA